MKLRLRPEARRDLQDVGDYIARDDRAAARRFVHFLRQRCRFLADNPHAGRERPELQAGLRSFPVRGYVIFYRICGRTLEIVAVVHGSGDIDAIF